MNEWKLARLDALAQLFAICTLEIAAVCHFSFIKTNAIPMKRSTNDPARIATLLVDDDGIKSCERLLILCIAKFVSFIILSKPYFR